jgi:hypothetical protein
MECIAKLLGVKKFLIARECAFMPKAGLPKPAFFFCYTRNVMKAVAIAILLFIALLIIHAYVA